MAQMNDLQAQLEEANKEKQELQEKVGTRISLGRERVPGCGDELPSSRAASGFSAIINPRAAS